MPNFIDQKAKNGQKMTFCPPRHKNQGHGYGYDKTCTKVMARDINKTQKF